MSWTEKFFGDYYLKIHLPLLTDEVNQNEINFVEEILQLPQGASILDIPCGFGRHSSILAQKGYKVTGLDYKEEFISMAKENSKDLPNINFIHGDMKEITFNNEFDAIINLFTSFGYFSDSENFDILKRFSKALKIGGKIVIDIINREWAITQSKENGLVWLLYPDNKVFLANNKFDIFNGRWISEQIIVEHGKSFEQYQDIRLYSFTEIDFLLGQVGMQVIDAYGDNTKAPYSVSSRSMIIVAQKVS